MPVPQCSCRPFREGQVDTADNVQSPRSPAARDGEAGVQSQLARDGRDVTGLTGFHRSAERRRGESPGPGSLPQRRPLHPVPSVHSSEGAGECAPAWGMDGRRCCLLRKQTSTLLASAFPGRISCHIPRSWPSWVVSL